MIVRSPPEQPAAPPSSPSPPQIPASVIADLLNLHPPAPPPPWVQHAGGNWNSYAAQLARERSHPKRKEANPAETIA